MSASTEKALQLLANSGQTYADSKGAGSWTPPVGDYSCLLSEIKVDLGKYGRYRTGKGGTPSDEPCCTIQVMGTIIDHDDYAGKTFRMAYLTDRDGAGNREGFQDIDKLKSGLASLLDKDVDECQDPTADLVEAQAMVGTAVYKVKVSENNGYTNIYVNEFVGNQAADDVPADAAEAAATA